MVLLYSKVLALFRKSKNECILGFNKSVIYVVIPDNHYKKKIVKECKNPPEKGNEITK